MGNTTVRKCCDKIGAVNVINCPGDCLGADLAAQRRRVEQLIVEVDEARQENQRLNKQTSRLRVAIDEVYPEPVPGPGRDRSSTHHAAPGQPSRRVQENLLHLKRTLWELQRENALLKQGAAEEAHLGIGQGHDKKISLAQYQVLQRQLEELQHAYDSAAGQTERMRLRQQQSPSPVPTGNSQGGYAPSLLSGPSGCGHRYEGSVGRLSSAGSFATSGMATPVESGCHLSSLGLAAYSWKRDAGETALDGEMLRKMQAMQAENEQLRRKVRMLAAK